MNLFYYFDFFKLFLIFKNIYPSIQQQVLLVLFSVWAFFILKKIYTFTGTTISLHQPLYFEILMYFLIDNLGESERHFQALS